MRFEKSREVLRKRQTELRAEMLGEIDPLDEVTKQEVEKEWEEVMLADEARIGAAENAGELVFATICVKYLIGHVYCVIETVSIVEGSEVCSRFISKTQRKDQGGVGVLETTINECPPILRLFYVAYENGELEKINNTWDAIYNTPPFEFKMHRTVLLKEVLKEFGYSVIQTSSHTKYLYAIAKD